MQVVVASLFSANVTVGGEQLKLVGRAQKNQLFDRLEFVAQLVFRADAKEELELSNKEN